jgi:hypothetical protein
MHYINPLNEPLIKKLFKDKAYGVYKKKNVTLLRKPLPTEIGTILNTYIENNKESSSVIKDNSVIARNVNKLENSFNEWVIPYENAVKNYGKKEIDSLSFEFTPFYKIQTIKAIKLTELLLKSLNFKDTIFIEVPWSDEPMTGQAGDYLTDSGYIISSKFINTYELIEKPQKDIDEVLYGIKN